MEVGGAFAEVFIRAYHRGRTRLAAQPPLALRQRDVFDKRVRPLLGVEGEKVAYFLVDALRFEMGRELAQTLGGDFDVKLEAAIGTLPSITEIGMAALMPGAGEATTTLVPGATGKVALQIAGKTLRDRQDRVGYLLELLQARHGIGGIPTKLEDLLPQPKPALKRNLTGAGFVLVTSQEIDALCEGDNIPMARRSMDEILHQLKRAFRILADCGVTRIVCAADHGYLFAEELGDDMKIDPPGGETVDLHRRVWIGRGGANEDTYLRARLSEFGLASDLEVAVPLGFSGFRAGGALAYFHGGLAPQEIVIPVMTLAPLRRVTAPGTGGRGAGQTITWDLRLARNRITNRFCSVQVLGTASGLFPITVPPRVRVEIRAGSRVLSEPVAASYGFDEGTRDVQLELAAATEESVSQTEPCAVTLRLIEETSEPQVTIHLLDATTGAELTRLGPVGVSLPG
jgi:hypothetical protein